MHDILHWLGIDGQSSWTYAFWSGFGPVLFGQLPILGALLIHFRQKNCHVKGCWRIHTATDPVHGWPACKIHHSNADIIG